MTRDLRLVLGGLLTLAVLGMGCGREPGAGTARAPIPTPASAAGILEVVNASEADAVFVNVWAKWCVPCRAEFPDLVRLEREYRDRGFELVFVSTDFETPGELVPYLSDQGVDYPTYIKDETDNDQEFIEALHSEWSGAIPLTLVFDRDRTVRHFWEGQASYEAFEKKLLEVLNEPGSGNGAGRRG